MIYLETKDKLIKKQGFTEKIHLKNSLLISLLIVSVLVLIHLIPFDRCYGLEPRDIEKFYGIFLSPFLHSDWNHLWSNIGPLFLFLAGLFYYLPDKFFKILITSTIVTNIIVWGFARDGCHIGSSGVVYFLFAFLMMLSIIKKNRTLGAFSLIIVFLYGSMVWGVFPLKERVSWESHAIGAVVGIVYGFIFRKSQIRTQQVDEISDEQEDIQNETEIKQEEVENQLNEITTSRFKHKQKVDNWHNYTGIEYSYKSGEKNE